MVQRLDSLRHDVIVGSDNHNNDIGDLGTTGTHSGKRLVTRGIQEGDATAVGQLHVIGTDVLGDTTSLTGNDVRVADVVQQRGLTVVNVTHDGHNRRTLNEICGIVFLVADGLGHLGTGILGLEAKLVGNNVDGLGVQTLVDAHHHAQVHTSGDNLVDGHVHHACQVIGSHKLGELEHLALGCCLCSLFTQLLAELLAFLTTAGCCGLLTALGGETGQRLLHLTLNVLLADLGPERTTVLSLVPAALAALVLLAATALTRL